LFCRIAPELAESSSSFSSIVGRLWANSAGSASSIAGAGGQRLQSGEVEVHLPGILRRELTDLGVDHHVATEFEVVEERIDLEFVAPNMQGEEVEVMRIFQQLSGSSSTPTAFIL